MAALILPVRNAEERRILRKLIADAAGHRKAIPPSIRAELEAKFDYLDELVSILDLHTFEDDKEQE